MDAQDEAAWRDTQMHQADWRWRERQRLVEISWCGPSTDAIATRRASRQPAQDTPPPGMAQLLLWLTSEPFSAPRLSQPHQRAP
jgi:hypothetical protein